MKEKLKQLWASQVLCYSCGQPTWFCNARHSWLPVIEGVVLGCLVGLIVGATLAYIKNRWFWL